MALNTYSTSGIFHLALLCIESGNFHDNTDNRMIFAILNQKGGVGKTTLTVHLSAALAMMDNLVLLADVDLQGSALDWAASRKAEPLVRLHQPEPE